MKQIKWVLLLLIVPLLLAACNNVTPVLTESPAAPAPSPTQGTAPSPASNPTPVPTPVPTPTPIPGPASETLLGLLPSYEGYTWDYHGHRDYAHTMSLDAIQTGADGLVQYGISGCVENMPDGGPIADPEIQLTYTVGADCIVQEKNAPDMLDSRFDRIELIRTPLTLGNTWEQTVYDREGQAMHLLCTIVYIEERTPGTVYYVDYKDTASDYEESRCLQEGIGVISAYRYHDMYGSVGHSLYMPADIVNGELAHYLPPLDTDLLYSGADGYAHRGRLSLSRSNGKEAVYIFDGVYQDGLGPTPFQIRYYVDYHRGTVTERVMLNSRTGIAEVNSKPHNLVILMLPMQLPLRQGFVWSHEAAIDGQPCKVQAEAVECDLNAGYIRVRYTAQGVPGYYKNTYIEERIYERGYGMTSFRCLLPGDIVIAEGETEAQAIASHMFAYALDKSMLSE